MSRGPPPPSASYGLNIDDLLIDDGGGDDGGGWPPVAVAEPLLGGAAWHDDDDDDDGGMPTATAEVIEAAEEGGASGDDDVDGDDAAGGGAEAPVVVQATAYVTGDGQPAVAATIQATAAAPPPLEVGQLVVLTGLAREGMNGIGGELLAALGGDRWEVRIAAADSDDADGGPHRNVSIRACNLAPKPIEEVGERVRLHSVIRSDELNGMTGHVLSTNAGTGRINVRLSDGRLVALLPGNARAVSENCRGEHSVPPGGYGGGAAGRGSVPLLAETSSDPDRASAQPSGGIDAALGDVFSTGGVSNAGRDVPAATAIAG